MATRPRGADLKGQKHCSVCGRKRKLVWDHDHRTGEFRGWLCSNCNTGLGLFGDSPERLLAAIEYLQGRKLALIRREC